MTSRNQNLALTLMALFLVVAFIATHFFFKVKSAAMDTTFSKEYALALSDYEGNTVHLYDYRRKVLIAYAWAYGVRTVRSNCNISRYSRRPMVRIYKLSRLIGGSHYRSHVPIPMALPM